MCSAQTANTMNENGRLHDIFSVSGPHFPAFSFESLIFILDIIIKNETTKIGFDFVELCWKIVKDRQSAENKTGSRDFGRIIIAEGSGDFNTD